MSFPLGIRKIAHRFQIVLKRILCQRMHIIRLAQ